PPPGAGGGGVWGAPPPPPRPRRRSIQEEHMNGTLSRTGQAGLAIAAVALMLAGCSDVERAVNKGGDTKCSDYVQQDQDKKRVTITKFVKQQTNDDHEPAGTVVDATMVSVDLLCGGQRNADTPIKNADVAGIFLNK
ncbi:hypothetical protein, partial [Nocardia brasiliensis]|uniref:hypothetical protein n=1 Tax=Nocardia brasiliensis TaxID=37326 RepID=UPI002454D721